MRGGDSVKLIQIKSAFFYLLLTLLFFKLIVRQG